jgi:hypothetical protein
VRGNGWQGAEHEGTARCGEAATPPPYKGHFFCLFAKLKLNPVVSKTIGYNSNL